MSLQAFMRSGVLWLLEPWESTSFHLRLSFAPGNNVKTLFQGTCVEFCFGKHGLLCASP